MSSLASQAMELVIIVVVIFFPLFVITAVFALESTRHRDVVATARRRMAEERGWKFAPTAPNLLTVWKGDPFDLFPPSPSLGLHALSAVYGDAQGIPFVAFDFHYRDIYNYRYVYDFANRWEWDDITVWALLLPAPLPYVSVETSYRGGGARALDILDATPPGAPRERFFTGERLFTGDPAFDQEFPVRMQDPRLAAQLLTPAVRAYLTEFRRVCGPGQWHTEGRYLLFRRHRTLGRVGGGSEGPQLPETTAWLAGLVQQFPQEVWQAR